MLGSNASRRFLDHERVSPNRSAACVWAWGAESIAAPNNRNVLF
jgi:hypothetical protein